MQWWWIAFKWSVAELVQRGAFKKSMLAGAMVGAVYASVTNETDAKFALNNKENLDWRRAHDEKAILIMSNLNETLGDIKANMKDMKNEVHETRQQTFFLYKREIEKNK